MKKSASRPSRLTLLGPQRVIIGSLMFGLVGCGEGSVAKLPDAASLDSGVQVGPWLCGAGGNLGLVLRGSSTEAFVDTVLLESCGTEPVGIERVALNRTLNLGSLKDFEIVLPGCRGLECELDVQLCPAAQPDCEIEGRFPGVSFPVPIHYENLDGSEDDGLIFGAIFTGGQFVVVHLSVGP